MNVFSIAIDPYSQTKDSIKMYVFNQIDQMKNS